MKTKLYDGLYNKYSTQKTLRFGLIPQGKTKEYMETRSVLSDDEHRADSYKKVKKIIDEYHKWYIDEALTNVVLEGLDEYYTLYMCASRNVEQEKQMEEIESLLRKQISNFLKSGEEYKELFKEGLIKKELVRFVDNDEERLTLLREFKGFTTYFQGFYKNRENMYSDEKKSTAIGFRLVNQNLPKFLDNKKQFGKINERKVINLSATEKECTAFLSGKKLQDIFELGFYNNVLTQKGIESYNYSIGEINKRINLYNQTVEKSMKLGKLKKLYKQILSDRVQFEPLLDKFEEDQEAINAIKDFSEEINPTIEKLQTLLEDLGKFDLNNIYVKNDKYLTDISQKIFNSWSTISDAIIREYDEKNLGKGQITEKYEEKRNKVIKNIGSFSIDKLCSLVNDKEKIEIYFSSNDVIPNYYNWYKELHAFANIPYKAESKLMNDKKSIETLKNYLDSLLKIQHFIKPLRGNGNEAEKDERFYAEFMQLCDELDNATILYNKVRNYLTQKSYSTEKIKLNFGVSQLLAGWDINKEKDYQSILLERKGLYYLGIMSGVDKKIFDEAPKGENKAKDYKKMNCKVLPGPSKMLPKVFFGKKNLSYFQPSEYIKVNYDKGMHKKGPYFDLKYCHDLIDFFKKSIEMHPDWKNFNFSFSDTSSYEDISGFYHEVEKQGYKISFVDIDADYVDKLVDEGKLYLFQIYNKDFSPNSKGIPNLHTLYWKMLFDPKNLEDVVYKLNGGGEIFYRKASIKEQDKIVHNANEPILNKNKNNKKEKSTFEYDIVKDRRYTIDKMQLHIPITMNHKAEGIKDLNEGVRHDIKNNSAPYVIGIDRGERHLLYLVVIDPDGNIVEQYSMNDIITVHKGNEYKTGYHDLLDEREKARDKARKDWQSIQGIKDLKEGYLSQVIHKITMLMVKYNAIVVLEDLNVGFIRGRQKIEKQVYQKFEHMLIDKLNYLVDKRKADIKEPGGLLKAYQLTNDTKSFTKLGKQSGVLFYIPAWNTSKMDPTTGFVNLFYTKYESVDKAIGFWSKFDRISYNDGDGYFEFEFDYNNFTYKAEGTRSKWTVCSFGERIRSFRNSEKNGNWDNETIDITQKIKGLLEDFGMDYNKGNLVQAITSIKDKAFHESFIYYFKLVLQMRNSETGTEVDYLISPVKNNSGKFYCSQDKDASMPENADANGAYNIARKGLWVVEQIKKTEDADLRKVKLTMTNKEWLQYAQEHCANG